MNTPPALLRSSGALRYVVLLLLAATLPAQSGGLSKGTLSRLTLDELLALAREVRTHAEPLLLSVGSARPQGKPDGAEDPTRGRCRLLPRDHFVHAVETRGGGSYVSFATGSQSFDREPDLTLWGDGEYASGFYGGATGLLVDLGPRSAAVLDRDPTLRPRGVSADLWAQLLRPLPEGKAEAHGAMRDLARRAETLGAKQRLPATPGHAYLLRSMLPGEHDLLAIFRFDGADQYGHRIRWRVMKTFVAANPEPPAIAGPPPLEVTAPARLQKRVARMRLPALLSTAGRLREVIHERLLRIPARLEQGYRDRPGARKVRLCRIVRAQRYTQVTLGGERGPCYFSFATGENSYDAQPDLELTSRKGPKLPRSSPTDPVTYGEKIYYSTGFYGGTTGFLHDLGPVDLLTFSSSERQPPAGVDPEIWKLFFRDAKTTEDSYDRAIDKEARRLKISDDVTAVVGHTYLLRAILPGEHDHLVAFTLLEDDGHGHTLAWRLLKRW